MGIVATTETRNAHWANDQSSFGRKMLSKMGWKGDGTGLGKNQQGSSTHLRAVKRSESLGIGAESDAFGDKGWQDTNAGFHGVLANLKREYSSVGDNDDSNSDDIDIDVDEATKKKRRKEEKKRKKKEEKRKAKRRNSNSGGESANSSNGDAGNGNRNGIRLPQNKVQAGHARKMREAKDIRNKSSADMAAIFGVKADFYKQSRDWIEWGGEDSGPEKKKKKSPKKKSEKKESKRKRSSDEDGNGSDNSKKKKRKKDSKSK